jgi:hypothetical protein
MKILRTVVAAVLIMSMIMTTFKYLVNVSSFALTLLYYYFLNQQIRLVQLDVLQIQSTTDTVERAAVNSSFYVHIQSRTRDAIEMLRIVRE